jgi:hypothetical protein
MDLRTPQSATKAKKPWYEKWADVFREYEEGTLGDDEFPDVWVRTGDQMYRIAGHMVAHSNMREFALWKRYLTQPNYQCKKFEALYIREMCEWAKDTSKGQRPRLANTPPASQKGFMSSAASVLQKIGLPISEGEEDVEPSLSGMTRKEREELVEGLRTKTLQDPDSARRKLYVADEIREDTLHQRSVQPVVVDDQVLGMTNYRDTTHLRVDVADEDDEGENGNNEDNEGQLRGAVIQASQVNNNQDETAGNGATRDLEDAQLEGQDREERRSRPERPRSEAVDPANMPRMPELRGQSEGPIVDARNPFWQPQAPVHQPQYQPYYPPPMYYPPPQPYHQPPYQPPYQPPPPPPYHQPQPQYPDQQPYQPQYPWYPPMFVQPFGQPAQAAPYAGMLMAGAEPFQGKEGEDIVAWLDGIITRLEVTGWNEEQKLRAVLPLIQGNAWTAYVYHQRYALPEYRIQTWGQLQNFLLERYVNPFTKEEAAREFHALTCPIGKEDLFVAECQRLIPKLRDYYSEQAIYDHIKHKVRARYVRDALFQQERMPLDDLFRFLIRAAASQRAEARQRAEAALDQQRRQPVRNSYAQRPARQQQQQQQPRRQDNYGNQQQANRQNPGQRQIICFRCRQPGHIQFNCPQQRPRQPLRQPPHQQFRQMEEEIENEHVNAEREVEELAGNAADNDLN